MSEATPPGEPERVRSGTFRVDRRRALEMLARYQLLSPYLFPLPWVRAAVAAGATRIEACDVQDRFELRFASRPFMPAELRELLASLPAEQADARLRELARGVLSAFGAKVQAIALRSGPAGERMALRLTSEGEALEPIDEEDARTILGVVWGPAGRPSEFDEGIEALRRFCEPGLLRFYAEDRPVGRLPEGRWERFEVEGLRGWLAEGRRGEPSQLYLHKLGVACGIWMNPVESADRPQARAVLNDDALELTLAQTGVVEDEAFKRMLQRLGDAVDAMAVQRLKELSQAMPVIGGWLLDPKAYVAWKAGLGRTPDRSDNEGIVLEAQREFALDADSAAGRREEIERWAPIVGWLRDTAMRVLGDGRPARTALERALWSTPLFLTVDGLPATVDESERQRLRFGRLTIGERRHSGELWMAPTLQVRDRRRMLELLAGPVGDRLT